MRIQIRIAVCDFIFITRFMYGNPGDYAFGRAGLDAIITQLLNQMDGTGPPPMAKDKTAQIPTVHVEQHQIGE